MSVKRKYFTPDDKLFEPCKKFKCTNSKKELYTEQEVNILITKREAILGQILIPEIQNIKKENKLLRERIKKLEDIIYKTVHVRPYSYII